MNAIVMIGTNSVTPSMPTANDDFVSWYICHGSTTKLIMEPK